MKYLRTIMRTAAVVTSLTAVVAAPTGALASPTQAFHANSGDNCRYGQTDGDLAWWSTSLTGVDVTGVVVDRPAVTDPGPACPDDRRYTVATFAGYANGVLVDSDRRQVDNGRLEFRFVLGNSTSTARINRVVVQVCRASLTSTVPAYCGPAQSYSPLSTTP